MSQTSIETRVRQLERRLDEVEDRPMSRLARFLRLSLDTREERIRFFGWTITTFSLLGFLSGTTSENPAAGIFFGVSLVLGVLLIMVASGLISHSDSHLKLQQEHRATKHLKAHHLHHAPGTRTEQSFAAIRVEQWLLIGGFLLLSLLVGWAFTMRITDPFIQIMPAALVLTLLGAWAAIRHHKRVGLIAIVALTALLCVATHSVTALMAALAGFGVIWMAGWEGRDIDVLSWSGFGLTGVAFGQLYWGYARLTEAELLAAVGAALMGLILAATPYAASRRTLERRDFSRFALVLTPIVAVACVTAAGPYTPMQNLLSALALIVLGYGAMAYVAWLSHHRMSYAKYFLTVTLAALLLFVYLILDPISVALIWFLAGVLVVSAGFTLPSYSARLLGLALLVVAILNYLFTVLGAPQIAGPALLKDRVWMGLLMSIFLPALALWYKEARLKGAETRLVPLVSTTLSAAAALILAGLVLLDMPFGIQSVALLAVGGATLYWGKFLYLYHVAIVGFIISLLGLLKLLFIDMLTLGTDDKLLVLLAASLILIVLGVILPKRRKV